MEEPLFNGLDLKIEPGSSVALVGGSGSGKTTVGRLITGDYQPWEGAIRFDGNDRKQIPDNVMVKTLATVDQEIALFKGTVRDNLTFWDSSVPEETLRKACADAAILDLILELPGVFDSELIEGGSSLSGGQRQRIEIARALIGNPSVLLLDEATSALDSESEQIVMSNLRQRGCTTVLIAHRLSTIRDCDQIILLQNGSIVEQGTHSELWSLGGDYHQLMMADEVLSEEEDDAH